MPGNRQAYSTAMNAADRFRWDSQWERAAQEYQRALAELPDDAMARSGLGFCYMQTKQWQPALDEYEYTLKRDPGNVIALSKTAELYGILNRREDAYRAYLHLADLYWHVGQGTRAEATWQKAVQLAPGHPEPHERLAAYYAGKKDVAFMLQERLAAAQGYYQRHDMASAYTQCEEILRVDAANRQAQQLLSLLRGNMQAGSPPSQAVDTIFSSTTGRTTSASSSPSAFTDSSMAEMVPSGNINGGNTSIMGNMGSASNFGGVGNPGMSLATASAVSRGMEPTSHRRITASQVTGALRQAQTFQTQGRFNDAIDLCEQILESGFDRPDARYFLGWLYQEQQRWEEAIQQYQMLLNDPDYALSCYYALGQCYRAGGDLRTATLHFDEAVDRVNLDALTIEESDQLVQLCQEAAEAHRLLGEQEQALTVYNALLGFLRSRGWNDKVAQVELMFRQAQSAPVPQQGNATWAISSEQGTKAPSSIAAAQQQETVPPASSQLPASPVMGTIGQVGELPDWLTGILSDEDKTQTAVKPGSAPSPVRTAAEQSMIVEQPTIEQSIPTDAHSVSFLAAETIAPIPSSWLTDDPTRPANVANIVPPDPQRAPQTSMAQAHETTSPEPKAHVVPLGQPHAVPVTPLISSEIDQISPILQQSPVLSPKSGTEDLLSQIAGPKDEALKQVAGAVLASTATLPENVRLQVAQSMQDIQKYINHGLLTPATEECLRVIDMAPQYLDVHQVLCEIYVRQGKVEQAITKYAILVDTYVVNGRLDDAIATYRRILQLEPNNLTYRMRLISLLSSQGNKEDLLRERTLAAESYLRLGYMDRALTELEQALQESPTSVATRLNYALALQKLGRPQQAVAEYQRVLQIDPGNLTALVRSHIAMITSLGTGRATTLECLARIRWQLRGEGQRNYETVVRDYTAAAETHQNNSDIQFALGQLHQQAGNYDKTLEAYQLAMRDSAVEVLARVSASHCMLGQGKPEAAIQQLEQALQTLRHSPTGVVDPGVWAARPREEGEEHQAPEVEISLLLAKAYRRTGRLEQMQAILRQVKQKTTYQDEVSSALADISARRGDIDSALQEYADLVHHYRSKRQTENALSVLKEMVHIAPQDPRAHDALVDVYVNRGLLEEGIAELRLLADIYLRRNQFEHAAEALQRIGNIYAETGNTEETLTTLRRAVELNPNSLDLLREIVGFCLQLGRANDAAQYQVIIARHYVETQQVKEAVAALQQLITIDRNNYEAYDLLGQTYQSVGEYEQASRVYRNLAKVNPDNALARERLATLQELRTK